MLSQSSELLDEWGSPYCDMTEAASKTFTKNNKRIYKWFFIINELFYYKDLHLSNMIVILDVNRKQASVLFKQEKKRFINVFYKAKKSCMTINQNRKNIHIITICKGKQSASGNPTAESEINFRTTFRNKKDLIAILVFGV